MCVHMYNDSLTLNFGVFKMHQSLTHILQFTSLRTQGARVSVLLMRRLGPEGLLLLFLKHVTLNLGYQHPEFGLLIPFLPSW